MKITNTNRALVLAALYNASKCQGMGFFSYNPKPMTEEEAQKILDAGHRYFDYLKGRVMKVDLTDDVDFFLYDRDNGNGAGYRACKGLEVE